MRRIRRLQLIYGMVWGGLAFLAGVAVTYYVAGAELLSDTSAFRTAAWLYLGANDIGVEGSQLGLNTVLAGRVNLLDEFPDLRYLRAVPVALSLLGAILVAESIGYSNRVRHIMENCLCVVPGYVLAGVAVLYASNAQPTLESLVLLLLGFVAVLFVGGTVLSSASGGLQFIGLASVGTVLAVGLVFVGGGIILVTTLAPLVLYSGGGAAIGAVLLVAARRVRI